MSNQRWPRIAAETLGTRRLAMNGQLEASAARREATSPGPNTTRWQRLESRLRPGRNHPYFGPVAALDNQWRCAAPGQRDNRHLERLGGGAERIAASAYSPTGC